MEKTPAGRFAKIIVDISRESLDKAFDYHVPDTLSGKVVPGVQVTVPFGKGRRTVDGFVIALTDTPSFDPSRIRDILAVKENSVAMEGRLISLAAWMKNRYGGSLNQALKTVLPVKKKVKPVEKKTVVLCVSKEAAVQMLEIFDRKKNKARVRLMSALLQEPQIPYEFVTGKLSVTPASMKKMEEMGLIRIESKEVYRTPLQGNAGRKKSFTLTEEQQAVVDGIRRDEAQAAATSQVFLIHGVTGSGKTEVYMELIAGQVRQGKQCIMLIPEIALTYQTVMRFYSRFGSRISILHSKLSAGERYDQYLRAKRGEIDIMIGPRSALFTPFPNLGLIIIDEEHEPSYQSETVPRYDAREAAIQMGKMAGADVVLGSATPSLESYYAALQGRYHLYKLPHRVHGQKMASVQVVDLREEMEEGNRSPFSRVLQQGIARRLERGEQVMLFLNRRGMAGFLSCRSCGHVIKCPHCDISLSVHRDGKMVCHYCGYEAPLVHKCPSCGSPDIGQFRAGTQKMEELVKKKFPKARVLRMDADTTREKGGHEKILAAFASQEADILIGTQMIVKGHDFPNVTLVGVLAADLSLNVPDYTAAERTFQLLTQAAGRAGRGYKKGEVIIQTYQPDHFAIEDAAAQDYRKFYDEEIQYRSILHYPPVYHLMEFQASSSSQEMAEAYIKRIRRLLDKSRAPVMEKVEAIGPSPAPVAKVKDIYRQRIYLKSKEEDALIAVKDAIELYYSRHPQFAAVSIQFYLR